MLTTRTSTTKGHKSLGVKSYLWVFLLVIYISKMCYKECTSVIIIPDCHSPKKKKRVYVFLSIFYYDDISQVLQSHDTKHPTEKFSGGKKNYFMVPNQHQRTQLLSILRVLRAYWQIETRIFKAGIILEDPVTVFIELRIQMFDRLPSRGACYLQAANAY